MNVAIVERADPDLRLPLRGITLRRDHGAEGPATYRHAVAGASLEVRVSPSARVPYVAILVADVEGLPIRNESTIWARTLSELDGLLVLAVQNEALADALCMLSAKGKR